VYVDREIYERYTLKTYHFSLIGLGFFCSLLNIFQLYQFTGSSEEHLLLEIDSSLGLDFITFNTNLHSTQHIYGGV